MLLNEAWMLRSVWVSNAEVAYNSKGMLFIRRVEQLLGFIMATKF